MESSVTVKNKAYKTVAYIPLRGGSQSIPLKNIKPIAGKPLAHWAIEAALLSEEIDAVFVATDSEIIKRNISLIKSDKLRVIDRSAGTATNEASTESALLEFCYKYPEHENVVLIQATSPLLTHHDLDNAIKKWRKEGHDSLLSVVNQKRFIWDEGQGSAQAVNYNVEARPRRQEFKGFLVENGAFYISKQKDIIKNNNRISGKIGTYEMDEETYFELDEQSDWIIIEGLLKKRNADFSTARNKEQPIKLVMMDVDGVLTDSGMYYTENGDEIKKFSTYDGKAIEILREKGIKTAIITSENTKLLEKRAKKLKVDYLFQGVKDKLLVAREICDKEGFDLLEAAYIGDDINDLTVLQNVGLAACPENAVNEVKAIPGIIHLSAKGGAGAVRSFLKYIFREVDANIETFSRVHRITHRPWGFFETLNEGHGRKIKRICVKPAQKLSLQKHHYRSEHWTVVQGVATVTVGNEVKTLKVNETVYIPMGELHRLENNYDIPLEIIEVQVGSYLEEDDIIRYDDIYGRHASSGQEAA